MKIYNISEIPEGLRVPSYEEVLLSGYTDGYEAAYDGYKCYPKMYFTIEAFEDGVIPNLDYGMYYSLNGGEWVEHQGGQFSVSAGDKVMFKKNTTRIINEFQSMQFRCAAYGNTMSLLYGDDFVGRTDLPSYYSFTSLFSNSTGLFDASNVILPATTLGDYCYAGMFNGCTSLVGVPELPATTLAADCYFQMFRGCTSLTTTPELPVMELALRCYGCMFENCTALTTAPELPATALTEYCYGYMFRGCTSLVDAPELPATMLAENCYSEMFKECTSLVNAPELPSTIVADFSYNAMFSGCTSLLSSAVMSATTLGSNSCLNMYRGCTALKTFTNFNATTLGRGCCNGMFLGCESLITVPSVLPATSLAVNCYNAMFQDCTSLTTAPELPATTLAQGCYQNMFWDCTSLTVAPELPATTLAESCYLNMFCWCSSLVNAPELPATTLYESCYNSMFLGCSSLVAAPELPAETLVGSCYKNMFYLCSSLNYIKCLALDISAEGCVDWWVYGVWGEGTFIHPCGVPWEWGNSGIPGAFEEVDDCHDYSLDHTTMEIMTGGTIQFGKAVANAPDAVLDYSLDSGSTWTTITSSTSPYVIQVQAGDVLMFRGDNPHGLGDYIGGNSGSNNTFSGSTAYFKVYGNIMSLISRTGFEEMTVAPSDRGVFSWLFMDTNVVEAKNLVLPAAAGDICFNRMFANCVLITESPVIPEQAAAGISTYFAMFSGCTSLNKVTALMTNLGTNGTSSWMDGVAQTGTFIKNPNMNSWSSGASGIPTGWTIVNAT